MVIDDFCTIFTKTIGLEHKVVKRYVKKRHISGSGFEQLLIQREYAYFLRHRTC